MNEEEMDEQIVKIIKQTMGNLSYMSCNHSESHCDKDSLEYEPKHIHRGTERCKGPHKKN